MEKSVMERRVITIDELNLVEALVKAGSFRLFEALSRIGSELATLNEITTVLMMAQIRAIDGELDFRRAERVAEDLQTMVDRFREALADVKREFKAACKEPHHPIGVLALGAHKRNTENENDNDKAAHREHKN